MGRLFWKLFAAFFLALVSTVMTVGNIMQWEIRQTQPDFSIRDKPHDINNQASPRLKPYTRSLSAPAKNAPPVTRALNYLELSLHFPPIALIFCIVFSVVIAGVLAWAVTHPIKLLLEHLNRVGEGDLQTRVSPLIGRGHDEFSELGQAFDVMAMRLDSMMKSQANMMHHISHELRSPLARIQMAVGLVLQNPIKLAAAMQRVEMETQRMENMIAELLEMFRLESGKQKLRLVDVDLNELLHNIVNDARFEKQTTKIAFLTQGTHITVLAELKLIHRAIENVIRNAIKYGPVDEVVTVVLAYDEAQQRADIEVIDRGKGVAADELEQIFMPFVRGSRSANIDGHGVGLAMTKHIIEAHGGQVIAENLAPTGFKVSLHLPRNPPALANNPGAA